VIERSLPKCLKTFLRHSHGQVEYFLPYDGNLTANKIKLLTERLTNRIADQYVPHMTKRQVKDALHKRLSSDWLTGREKDVTFEKDSFGTYTIKGEGWFLMGWKLEDFCIVE
jgi:hypothetical protein